MVKTLYCGASSACFELENKLPYYAPAQFTVCLNGKEVSKHDTNVFSIFGLDPDTDYEVTVCNDEMNEKFSIHTKSETCVINVKDFGAKGDGVTDDTVPIQTAVHFVPRGGRVFFPAGTYLTLPIALRSHTTIEFAEGATLLGSTDRERYPILPGYVLDCHDFKEVHYGVFEGYAVDMYQSLICAEYAEDITIIGPGTVDGNAQNGDWWQHFTEFPASRPRLLFFNRCKDVTIHGIHACNAAAWQLHPYFTKNFNLYDVFVSAPKISPNTDAMDPESCDYVNIIGCRFSVGDDCIAIKSGKIELGKQFKQPADHHTIRNCLMAFGHGAITLGSEIGAGVTNLNVEQCYFKGTDRGLRIKTRRGRGEYSVIENVEFDNIRMEDVLTPIVINMWYNKCDPDGDSEYVWSREHLPVDDRTPHLGSFAFTNMVCTGAQVAACYIDGLPEAPVDSVKFENVDIQFAEECTPSVPAMMTYEKKVSKMGLYLDNVKDIKLKNVTVEGYEGDVIIADHYEKLDVDEM